MFTTFQNKTRKTKGFDTKRMEVGITIWYKHKNWFIKNSLFLIQQEVMIPLCCHYRGVLTPWSIWHQQVFLQTNFNRLLSGHMHPQES
jgi:hypothetical protein